MFDGPDSEVGRSVGLCVRVARSRFHIPVCTHAWSRFLPLTLPVLPSNVVLCSCRHSCRNCCAFRHGDLDNS